MPEISDCSSCRFNAHNYYLVCAVHPAGPNGDTCPDFEKDPELKGRRYVDFLGLQHQAETELCEPEGASFYNGQLILQPGSDGLKRNG